MKTFVATFAGYIAGWTVSLVLTKVLRDTGIMNDVYQKLGAAIAQELNKQQTKKVGEQHVRPV